MGIMSKRVDLLFPFNRTAPTYLPLSLSLFLSVHLYPPFLTQVHLLSFVEVIYFTHVFASRAAVSQ